MNSAKNRTVWRESDKINHNGGDMQTHQPSDLPVSLVYDQIENLADIGAVIVQRIGYDEISISDRTKSIENLLAALSTATGQIVDICLANISQTHKLGDSIKDLAALQTNSAFATEATCIAEWLSVPELSDFVNTHPMTRAGITNIEILSRLISNSKE